MIERIADRSFSWLLNSDLQEQIANGNPVGGVHRGYDRDKASYQYLYCEITGYYISTLVRRMRQDDSQGLVGRAKQAANFLLSVQAGKSGGPAEGAIPQRWIRGSDHPTKAYYSFDNAMCLQGLLDLYRVSGESALRERGESIGRWLLQMQNEDGSFLAWLDGYNGQTRHEDDVIFDDCGCLHAKHAISLIKLGVLTGHELFVAAAEKVCNWVLTLQDEDGAVRASNRTQQIVSHTHCYAIEGLLYAYHHFGEKRYLEAARRAARWLLSVQHQGGAIAIAYKRRWQQMGRRIFELIKPRWVADATAQAIRIWSLLYQLDGDSAWIHASEKSAGFIGRLQLASKADRHTYGGLPYWKGHPLLFAWPTMFAAQALDWLNAPRESEGFSRLIEELF
jgi:uncharacterized protein YyaL (SSP411 family)